ncbi:hypothetical protein ACWEQ1_00330 [Streptomyces nodosus]
MGTEGPGRGEAPSDTDGTAVLPAAGGTVPPRDPWDSVGGTEHDHDPHEVTVQLERIPRQPGMTARRPGPGGPGEREGADGPVFVDESGRRSRRFRRIGMAVGLACAVYAVVIVATLLSGNSDAAWLPVPGQDDAPASKVDTSPLPEESVPPSEETGVAPDESTPVSEGAVPSQDTGAGAPAVTADPGRPDTSTAPEPSATTTTKNPSPGKSTAGTGPTASATPPADPGPTAGGGDDTAEPTPTGTGDTPGNNPPAAGAPKSPKSSTLAAPAPAGQPSSSHPVQEHVL